MCQIPYYTMQKQASNGGQAFSESVKWLHFRCGSIASREGIRRFNLISRVRASRIRRYTVSCSSSASSADGGSSRDQRRCRPAPEMIGQVSVAPLQSTIPSSQLIPNIGWMRRFGAMSGIPCSCNTCSARVCPCSSLAGVLKTSQRCSA